MDQELKLKEAEPAAQGVTARMGWARIWIQIWVMLKLMFLLLDQAAITVN